MVSDVSLDHIRERIVQLIENRHGNIEIASELDPSQWPIQPADLVTESNITRNGDTLVIFAEDEAAKDNHELRRRNATGGDYADIEQFIHLDATLRLVEDVNGRNIIPHDNPGDVSFFCELSVGSVDSHSGETPPF